MYTAKFHLCYSIFSQKYHFYSILASNTLYQYHSTLPRGFSRDTPRRNSSIAHKSHKFTENPQSYVSLKFPFMKGIPTQCENTWKFFVVNYGSTSKIGHRACNDKVTAVEVVVAI